MCMFQRVFGRCVTMLTMKTSNYCSFRDGALDEGHNFVTIIIIIIMVTENLGL